MSFVDRNDILSAFEGLAKHLFSSVKGITVKDFPQISYDDAMRYYGTDKPDIRFDMKFVQINQLVKEKGFKVFDDAELVIGICVKNQADYSRKQLDQLTDFVKRPQIGAKGLIYIKYNTDGTFKSSVDKFYSVEDLQKIAAAFNAEAGDLILIMAGEKSHTQKSLGILRLEMGDRLNLRDHKLFKPLWVVDFPLLEWDDETARYYAMHHPFTAPVDEDIDKLETHPGAVRANAYDLVINGVEIGGGSIRIHDRLLQQKMFNALGFSKQEAEHQFGFLLNAFEYGAPPHGGIAFGFDRWCALFGGTDSIRDYIAFPKNNAGRDVMIDSPASVSDEQLKELYLSSTWEGMLKHEA
jgi:aspartyl-tRNA synthetase